MTRKYFAFCAKSYREVKENKKNNKNKEKEGQARERCYGSCFWFVLFCDFLKTVKNIEK